MIGTRLKSEFGIHGELMYVLPRPQEGLHSNGSDRFCLVRSNPAWRDRSPPDTRHKSNREPPRVLLRARAGEAARQRALDPGFVYGRYDDSRL